MKFLSKADTLLSLRRKFPSLIPKLEIFKYKEFKKNELLIVKKIKSKFNGLVAVRSTYKGEDGKNLSNAGKYKSSLNIKTKSSNELILSINETLKSYEKKEGSNFFIQQMVKNVKFSGVCLTKSINSSIPVYEINYSENGKTDEVTSGKSNIKNLIVFSNKKYKLKDKNFVNLLKIIKRLIKVFNNDALDIEFAINKSGKIYILQVRPLVKKKRYLKKEIAEVVLKKISKKVSKLQTKHLNLFGNTTFFGVMPDWNPAEIIGIKPKPLSLSLYQELITNNVWSKNRLKCGYQDVKANHLMTTFYGTPYIDIRIDFNSWIPQNLKQKTKEKLVNYYLNEFKKNKKSHDKVEFDILFTCYTPDIEKKIKRKLKNILSSQEISDLIRELKVITLNLVRSYKKEIKLINILKDKQSKIHKAELYPLEKIYWLIEDCKIYGTDPFASLARCAFISIQLLNSLVKQSIISENEKYDFLGNIQTITSNIIRDFKLLTKKNFLNLYGHLRPNTYDITSLSYKEGFNRYFSESFDNTKKIKKFKFSKHQVKKVEFFLRKIGAKLSFNQFINFLKNSISQREYAKFVFTRSIDMIFENLKNFGKKYHFNNHDLSYIKIQDIMQLHYNLDNSNLMKKIRNEIKQNKKDFDFNKNIKLPEVITSAKDLYINHEVENKTNFVTTKIISSKIIKIENFKEKLSGKIVAIENADPGYDYIFNKKIDGLITKYGGINSHMAVRCAELSIPAAIGVGEILYEKIINKKFITLDCESKKIS